MGNPEQDARRQIDQLLVLAGWHVCDIDQANITAHRGVAIRKFPLPGQICSKKQLYTHPRNTSFKSVALYALHRCATSNACVSNCASRDRDAHHEDPKINDWRFTSLNLRTYNET